MKNLLLLILVLLIIAIPALLFFRPTTPKTPIATQSTIDTTDKIGQIVYDGKSFTPLLLTMNVTNAANIVIINKSSHDADLVIKSSDPKTPYFRELGIIKTQGNAAYKGITIRNPGTYLLYNKLNTFQTAGIVVTKK